MATFEWKPEHSVSISKMDSQHKKLFALAENLHSAMRQGRGRDALAQSLNELITYTKVHFSSEEDLLAQHGYPELGSQRNEHAQLVRKIEDFQKQFAGGNAFISIEVMDFIQQWINDHILRDDARYGNYLNQLGVY